MTQLNNGPIALKNVARFMTMTERLIRRDPHLPNLGVCHGHSGLGKTYASIFAQTERGARRIEIMDSWSRGTVWQAILRELGEASRKRERIADMAERALKSLAEEPERPLIIDEADKLVDKGLVEIVREIAETTGIPVILIGEEKLPEKLLSFERVHNRVLDWFPAQPCDLDDARALARAFAPKVDLADDLLEHIRVQSGGRARRIVVNLSRAAERGRNKNVKQLTLESWGSEPLFTGEPPRPRTVEPFVRRKAA